MTKRRQSVQNCSTSQCDSKRYWLSALRVSGSGVKRDTYSPAQFSTAYMQFFDQIFKVIRRHFLVTSLSQKCDMPRLLYRIIAM